MRYQTIRCDKTRFQAMLTLPEAYSGVTISEAVAEELVDCCRELSLDDDLRVVTIAGEGDTFATGREKLPDDLLEADLGGTRGVAQANGRSQRRGRAAHAGAGDPERRRRRPRAGSCFGRRSADCGGLRVRLGAGQPGKDGFPFDGMTQRLPRVVGPALARDMLLTGRTLSAAEALDCGLVNRVVARNALEETVAEMVERMIAAAPIAARYAKEAVAAAGDLPLVQGLRLEADLSIILQSTDDRAEGLRSFAEKRTPHFTGR